MSASWLRGGLITVGAGLLLTALASSRAGWVLDDAFIYQRIVRNALEGHGLVFSVGDVAEGFSSPAWTLLLLTLGRLGLRGFLAARALSYACALLSIAVVAFAPPPRWKTWHRALAATLIALQPSLSWWSVAGMEGTLCFLLAVCVAVAVVARRPAAALACVAFMPVARPEGVLLLGATLAWYGLEATGALPGANARRRRAHIAVALATLVPWVAWEAYRLVVFRAPVANSAAAKLVFDAVLDVVTPRWRGKAYLTDAADIFGGVGLLFGGAAAALVMARVRGRTGAPDREAWARVAFVTLSVAGYAAFVLAVRGDWMPGARLVLPVAGVLIVVGTDALARLERRGVAIAGLVAAGAIAQTAYRQHVEIASRGRDIVGLDAIAWPPDPSALLHAPLADRWAHHYAAYALRYTRPGESVLHLDVGQSGYLLGDLAILDQFGLVSRAECEFLRGKRDAAEMVERFRAANPSVAFIVAQPGTDETSMRASAPLMPELRARYVPLARIPWWSGHELVVFVRRDVVDRPFDPSRATRLVAEAPGLAWERAWLEAP